MQALKRLFVLSILLASLGTIAPVISLAQQANTVLTIALPEWFESQFTDDLVTDFEAAHPGLDVAIRFVSSEDMFFTPAHFDTEEHITKTLNLATLGDVIYTSSYQLSVEATRSGAYLDLSPLTVTDANLDVNDFFPPIWQSFQWEGGIWAVPVTAFLIMNVYDADAFDAANLPYPDDSWTFADYADAARALTQYKDSGSVDVPGLQTYYETTLLYSMLGRGIYDMTAFPETASLTNDDVVNLLTEWNALTKEGVFNPADVSFDYDQVPFHIEETWRIGNNFPGNSQSWHGALLPNGGAGMRVDAFAVSAGTLNPELAYELAMYLSTNIEIMNFFYPDSPARRSMVGAKDDDSPVFYGEKPEEVKALIAEGIETAIPISEMRYYDYLLQAKQLMNDEELDAREALEQIQQKLDANLALAQELGEDVTIIVEAPAPTPVLPEGKIALNFRMLTTYSPLPNLDQWEELAQEFAASDPEVGLIDFDNGMNRGMANEDDSDCTYSQFNQIQAVDLSTILILDPYLAADVNFDANDLIGNTLTQVTRDDQIWAMPLNITPVVLWVNTRLFNEAGVPIPQGSWTNDAFVDALYRLQDVTEDEPFQLRNFDGTYLMLLIASFGGLPIDPRSTDPIPDLTSTENIEAIRQTLDLAKEGYISYHALANFGGGGGGGSDENLAIYDTTLTGYDYRLQLRREGTDVGDFVVTSFPRGRDYIPIAINVGSAYISANTPYADACYRWISTLAQHPEVMDGLPARRSLLETAKTQGDDMYALYSTLADDMDNPDAVSFQIFSGSPGAFIYQYWMYAAFDAYVLEDANLDEELAEAQILIDGYTGCINQNGEIDPNTLETDEELQAYYQQYTDCAIQIDPSLSSIFGGGS